MKVISILAQKGGAGKTTLALHWAVEAERKKAGPVAVLDTDPQKSAVKWGQRRKAEKPIVLQAIPSQLGGVGIIEEALEACERAKIALTIIDTMPRAEKPNVEAARLADLAVIPCGPSPMDIEALEMTVEIVQQVGTPGVVVLNQGRPSSGINEKAIAVLERYGLPVCPVPVMRRAALADAFIDGRAVVELRPRSKGAREIAATWKWIQKELKKS